MSRQQRKRIWVVVALLVALIVALLIYLLIISFLGSDTYVQFISFDVDEMFFVIPVCIYTTSLFCGFLILLLGIILKYWIPFFGSNRQTEQPDPSNHHPGQDDAARG